MPKPTQYATPICIVLSILVVIGIVLGFYKHNPLIVTLFLVPAVAYEAYRTEGKSTRWASWILLVLIIVELILIKFKLNYNLASYLGEGGTYLTGYYIPFTDLRVLFPVAMIFLSMLLFFRTIGKYTKWLAVLIIISAIATVYILDPEMLKNLLRFGTSGYGNYYY